jgi:hypothetical protein
LQTSIFELTELAQIPLLPVPATIKTKYVEEFDLFVRQVASSSIYGSDYFTQISPIPTARVYAQIKE